jgi:putative transposase
MDAQHTKHVTYKLAYHFVRCPKYRKRILTGKIAVFVEQELRRLCEANTWTIGALNVQEDHVHFFLSASPSYDARSAGVLSI